MNKYQLTWTEEHCVFIKAENQKEAEERWAVEDYSTDDQIEVNNYYIKEVK